MKRSPLRAKRPTPRRKAPERVTHVRTRPKAGSAPSAAEKRHIERIAGLPCLVCGRRPVQVHHVTAHADRIGRIVRSPRRVAPLCFEHHKIEGGPESVEALNHRRFFEYHGIDLLAEADRLWLESEEIQGVK